MTEPTKTRWYQFDLRFLFLAVTLVAAWLAWQYGRNNEAKSPLAQFLKVGDEVYISEHGDTCSVKVYSSGAAANRDLLTIQRIDGETIHLKGRRHKRAITIASIRSVARYEPPPQTASNSMGPGPMSGAYPGAPGSVGMPPSPRNPFGPGTGGGAMPGTSGSPPGSRAVPPMPLPFASGSHDSLGDPTGRGAAPPPAPANQPGFAQPLPPPPGSGRSLN